MNREYEIFKWLSDVCKTSSWIGSAILSYFHILQGEILFIVGVSIYFIGMQCIAFKLYIKSLDLKEET